MKNRLTDMVSWVYHRFSCSPAALFEGFIISVLVQFAFLSFLSITAPAHFSALAALSSVFSSSHYWWGVLSLIGAASLLFEEATTCSRWCRIGGLTAAVASLGFLSLDFILRKPPIYIGGVLSGTAILFLGGLLYDRFKRD